MSTAGDAHRSAPIPCSPGCLTSYGCRCAGGAFARRNGPHRVRQKKSSCRDRSDRTESVSVTNRGRWWKTRDVKTGGTVDVIGVRTVGASGARCLGSTSTMSSQPNWQQTNQWGQANAGSYGGQQAQPGVFVPQQVCAYGSLSIVTDIRSLPFHSYRRRYVPCRNQPTHAKQPSLFTE